MMHRLAGLALLGLLATAAQAADWNQWRGPGRDNLAPDSPPLAESWPKQGPPMVWKNEEFPSGRPGGWGSPVVVGGRVFMLVHINYRIPTPVRIVVDQSLGALGHAATMPDELEAKVEQSRLSDERAALKPKELGPWITKWIEANVPDEAQRKKLTPPINARLARGKAALTRDILARLVKVKNKPFDTPEALDKWLDDSGIAGDVKKAVVAAVPTTKEVFKDIIVCLDAADGKTLWKREYLDLPKGGDAGCTPCVVDGRCYVIGGDSDVYCFDAADGREVWKVKIGAGPVHSSFLVADGLAIVMADPLTALDIKDGKTAWTQPKVKGRESSPALWRKDGQAYVLCNNKLLSCVDAKTGSIVWTAKGGGQSTPAVSGDFAAVTTEASLIGYKLTQTAGEKAWEVADVKNYAASPAIFGGSIYLTLAKELMCVNVQNGAVAWKGAVDKDQSPYVSPVIADGKMIANIGNGALLALVRAGPTEYKLLTQANLGLLNCNTPALVDGRLYVRRNKGVACYDLRVAPATAPAQ